MFYFHRTHSPPLCSPHSPHLSHDEPLTHVARIVERICKNGDIMTDKNNKKKEAQRYSREHDEPFLTFVTRIVNTENKAMTVNEICDKMDGASRSVSSNVHWHTSCSDAVRRGWIEKKQQEALSRVKTVPEAVAILSPDSEFSPRTNKPDEEE